MICTAPTSPLLSLTLIILVQIQPLHIIFKCLTFAFLMTRGPICPPMTTDGITKIRTFINVALFSIDDC